MSLHDSISPERAFMWGKPTLSKLLPHYAAAALQGVVTHVEPTVPFGDSKKRASELATLTAYLQEQLPNFFQEQ